MKHAKGWVPVPLLVLCAVAAVVCGTARRCGAEPAQALAQALRGYLLEASGDSARAAAALREAVAVDPESVELRVALTRLLASSSLDDALLAVDEGLRRKPGQVKFLALRARLLEDLGRKDEAAPVWLEAAAGGLGEEAFSGAVRALMGVGKQEEAEDAARRWVERFPKSPEGWFALGHVYLRVGRKDDARKSLEKALELSPADLSALRALAGVEEDAGNDDAASELYRRLVQANPHDVDARFRLAQALMRLRRPDDAAAVLQEAQKWAGSDPALVLRLGVLLLEAGKTAEAETLFLSATERHPADSRGWYLLGVTRLVQKNFEGALGALERVPVAAEEYSEALARRASALEGLKRGAEADRLVQGWLDGHPDDEGMLLLAAELREGRDGPRAAVDWLEDRLAKRPVRSGSVYFTLGVLWDKLKDWQRSADYMKQSLALSPDDPHVLNYLGYTYAEQGVYLEEAEKLVVRALALKPGDGAITDSLGWVYFKQGRFREAAEALARAAALLPKDAVIWEHVGDARRAAGDGDGARSAYQKAVELAPETEGARKKLSELP